MQVVPPDDILEADKELNSWRIYSVEKQCVCLKDDAPDHIKRLYKKVQEWHSKHHSTMN